MKNSTRRNIRRLTTPLGITLLVAQPVSGLTGLFRGPLTEAARSRESNTFVSGSSAPDEASRERIAEAFGKLQLELQRHNGPIQLRLQDRQILERNVSDARRQIQRRHRAHSEIPFQITQL